MSPARPGADRPGDPGPVDPARVMRPQRRKRRGRKPLAGQLALFTDDEYPSTGDKDDREAPKQRDYLWDPTDPDQYAA